MNWSWAEAGKGLIWEAVARGYYHQRVGVGLDYHQRVGVAMVILGGRAKVTWGMERPVRVNQGTESQARVSQAMPEGSG